MSSRGELLAYEFLLGLNPEFIDQPRTPDLGIDYIACFSAPLGEGKFVAVQVKPTEREIKGKFPVEVSVLKSCGNSTPQSSSSWPMPSGTRFTWVRDATPPADDGPREGEATQGVSLRPATAEQIDSLKQEIARLGQAAYMK